MQRMSGTGLQMKCPLSNGIIDSDLCIEVQECIDGNIPMTLELEAFLESDDSEEKCRSCQYHI